MCTSLWKRGERQLKQTVCCSPHGSPSVGSPAGLKQSRCSPEQLAAGSCFQEKYLSLCCLCCPRNHGGLYLQNSIWLAVLQCEFYLLGGGVKTGDPTNHTRRLTQDHGYWREGLGERKTKSQDQGLAKAFHVAALTCPLPTETFNFHMC